MAGSWFLCVALCGTCFSLVFPLPFHGMNEYSSEYILHELPYAYNGLEPLIDEATLRVHHTGHHAAYTKKMNVALAQWRLDPKTDSNGLSSGSIISIIRNIDQVPEEYRNAIRNNGGGYLNHNIYWSVMMPNPHGEEFQPASELLEDFNTYFGSFEEFKQNFTREASKLFGSGYVWLSRQSKDQSLVVTTTANQDCPISNGLYPILVVDVWEHAYYLKHQNRRAEHISHWWLLVNWDAVWELDNWWTKTIHDEL